VPRRYNRETLEVRYKGKTIADVLDMTWQRRSSSCGDPDRPAKTRDAGFGRTRLHPPRQAATTLSAGKPTHQAGKELSRRATGRTLYILDEPTTGLHFADVRRLIEVLGMLADTGNTVVVIEHQMDVVKTADWVIDLGPEGGNAARSGVAGRRTGRGLRGVYTGRFLREALGGVRRMAACHCAPGQRMEDTLASAGSSIASQIERVRLVISTRASAGGHRHMVAGVAGIRSAAGDRSDDRRLLPAGYRTWHNCRAIDGSDPSRRREKRRKGRRCRVTWSRWFREHRIARFERVEYDPS